MSEDDVEKHIKKANKEGLEKMEAKRGTAALRILDEMEKAKKRRTGYDVV